MDFGTNGPRWPAWLPVLAVGLLIGWADLHQTDTPVTVFLVVFLGFLFALGTNLPWAPVGVALGGFVPVLGLLAAALHWQIVGMEHGHVVSWTPRYIDVAGSLMAVIFALAGAAGGGAVRRFFVQSRFSH